MLVQSNVTLMALTMVSLHLLGQDDQNEVQHNIFGHVTPLAPLPMSYNTDDIIDGISKFLTSR